MPGFLGIHHGISYDDDDVAGLYLAGSCSVEAYRARASFSLDDIGRESFAVVVVDDVYPFAFDDVGCVEQVGINGDAADVVEVGLCYGYTVNL